MDRTLVELKPVLKSNHNVRSPAIFIHGFPDSSHIFTSYFEQTESWLKLRDLYTLSFTNSHSHSVPYVKLPNEKIVARPSNYRYRLSSESERELENCMNAPPTLYELFSGLPRRHFRAALLEVINDSPTGKIVIIAHDWGARYTWEFLREYEEVASDCVEFLVSLSVGSSIRYDVFEHGLKAFMWFYDILLCLPYYYPTKFWLQTFVLRLLQKFAGYQANLPPNE